MDSYYVYSIKDPRTSPAKPFYVGKGVGSRSTDHIINVDTTRKGKRISEILTLGKKPVVTIICDGLSEANALKMEAELISAMGTIDSGGILLNSEIPSGIVNTAPKDLIIPLGSTEKAQIGVRLLKEAIFELASANKTGIRNSDATRAFGLQSDYQGKQKDYLVYSILGVLLKEGKLKREDPSKKHKAIIHGNEI